MNTSHALLSALLVAVPLSIPTPTFAANLVSWVSYTGSGGLCTREAPCRQFFEAIGNTVPGGTVKCLDEGPYNGGFALYGTINIDCESRRGTILANAGVGIHISAYPNRTILRGLDIEGGYISSPGLTGIRIAEGGGSVLIENCSIHGFVAQGPDVGNGIYVTLTTGTTKIFVHNSTISGNGSSSNGAGITIKPSGTAKVRALITDSSFDNNRIGIWSVGLGGGVTLTVSDSSASGNSLYGIGANYNSQVNVMRAAIASNGTAGIVAASPATVRVGDSIITDNAVGVSGNVSSYRNNQIANNGVQGSPAPITPLSAGSP